MEEIEEKKEQLITAAMQIILYAGNARTFCSQAVDQANDDNFDEADKLMKQAKEEITKAHVSQTNIIQDEARGIEYPHSLLFTHAQDTLMTIKSEPNISEKIIMALRKISFFINDNK